MLAGGACSRQSTARARESGTGKAIPVKTIAARMQEERRVIEVTGTLQPYESVVISSQVAGKAAKVYADLGDHVKEGEPLVELDRREFEIAVSQAQASLHQVMSRLGLRPDEDPQGVKAEQTTDVMRAQASLDEAQTQYGRVKNLYDLKIGTQQAVDQADAAYKTAQANHRAAIDGVSTLKAQIEQYRATLDLARKKLDDTLIRAPFAGEVQTRFVSSGQFVQAAEKVFALVQTNPLRLRAEVAERFVRAIHENQQVKVMVEGIDQPVTARISRVSPAITEQSRTLVIEALVDNARQTLRPGLFARASIVSDQTEQVLLVPASAILNYYGITKVFAIDQGKVVERRIKLGDRFGDQFEVIEGLRPAEIIATSNLEKLTLGAQVQVNRAD